MGTPSQFGPNLFRILLYRNDAAEILLETSTEGFRLPILPAPTHRREAEEITAAIRTSWHLETYALFRLPASGPDHPFVRDYVLEACQGDSDGPLRMEWLSIDRLSVDAFQSPSDFAAIRNSLGILEQYRRGELPGPFGKPGWLRTVTEWAETQAEAVSLHLTGAVRQLNASPTFSLLRLESTGPALWFKAVGEPNLHEFSLTGKLAAALPEFLPRVLAAQPRWNAWLSVEAEGAHLTEKSPLSEWRKVASNLAQLQRATFGHTLHLIEAGSKDARVETLQSCVQPFFDFAARLMDKQTKSSPQPLSRTELRTLANDVADSLDRLDASGIPSVLVHMDLNLNNIVVGKSRCVFLDWAEGAIGHPFLSFEYLREHWRKLHGADAAAESALLSTYRSEWSSFISAEAIDASLERTPLVAAYASAVLHRPWHEGESSGDGIAIAPYLRSLTRRMKREAKALKHRRAPCVR